jgi:GrpB-like predicted nucleotidyltransferase (UPF0157 family)
VADEIELIGRPEHRAIVLVDYDEAWAARYERERGNLENALEGLPHHTTHVGSTAVPGLCAKPIIDIQVALPHPDDEASYLKSFEGAGYVLRVREPGHRMLRTPALDVQVHVCALGSDWERRHLLLREWLRRSEDERRLYGQLKMALSRIDWPTMNDYAAAKTETIVEITKRAERWAVNTGWLPESALW